MAVHLYRVNVEFPAAIWSVVLSLSDPPRVGDRIDVKGTGCVVREVVEQSRADSESTVAANVYADPVGDVATR